MRIAVASIAEARAGAADTRDELVAAFRRRSHHSWRIDLPFAADDAGALGLMLACGMLRIDADLLVATNVPASWIRHPRMRLWLLDKGVDVANGLRTCLDRMTASMLANCAPAAASESLAADLRRLTTAPVSILPVPPAGDVPAWDALAEGLSS